MSKKISRFSLFSQPLDRSIFVAYFLGAVVPLAALAWVAQRWIAPTLATSTATIFALGLFFSIGVLSLASFLAIRKMVRAAIARLDRENLRLSRLLETTRSLAVGGDATEILQLASEAAAIIAEGEAGHVVLRLASGELDITESNVSGSSDRSISVLGAAEQALETRAPAMRGAERGQGGLAIAVPCAFGPDQQGALVAWHASAVEFDANSLAALSMLSSSVTTALRDTDAREAERNFFTHATSLLVTALDNYLEDRSDHSRRVASLANQIGHALELAEAQRERMHFAALLHDIGMLRIRREHVRDIDMIRRHAELGDEMLRPIRVWQDLAPIVRHHHEWWNGGGYPDQLSGSDIPFESRIIAVAEAFDAMTSARSYQSAISPEEALERIVEGAGTQFDPQVVEAFTTTRRRLELA